MKKKLEVRRTGRRRKKKKKKGRSKIEKVRQRHRVQIRQNGKLKTGYMIRVVIGNYI